MKKTTIKTLTALALMSASHLALATKRELLVTDIEFVHPSKTQEAGYISKITFVPQSESYNGKQLGYDVLLSANGQMQASTHLLNGRTQSWGLGKWLLPEGRDHLAYSIHMPTKKQAITIFDDDGALTRGVLETLKGDKSLQAQSSLKCAKPLILYTGSETHKNHHCMSWQNNFKNKHLMYYAKPEQKDGEWSTVRINPANHTYKVAPNVVQNILMQQTEVYNAIQDEVESLSEMTTTSGTLLTKLTGAEEFSTTFAQELNNAAKDVFAKDATLKLHIIAKGFRDKTKPAMVWEQVDGEDGMTKKRSIEAIFESVNAGVHNRHDESEYYGYKLKLRKKGKTQTFAESGPVYYKNQEYNGGCVADSWSLHASKSAKKMLCDKLEEALQEKSGEILTYLSKG